VLGPKAVGIPVILPVGSIDSPAGRLGLTVNVKVPKPPVAVTGWSGIPVLRPCVSVVEAAATVVVIAVGAATDSMKVLELVCGTMY